MHGNHAAEERYDMKKYDYLIVGAGLYGRLWHMSLERKERNVW